MGDHERRVRGGPGNPGQLRAVSGDEVEAFWADGVVALRGILDPDFVASMAEPVERALASEQVADLSDMGDALAASGEDVLHDPPTTGDPQTSGAPRGQFRSGVDHWLVDEDFRRFACDSALPAIVGALLGATRVHLYEDSVLVKEPGTIEATAFHTDLSYFHVDGTQVCTTWVPLDAVSRETGAVSYVRASHRWQRDFRPNLFVSTMTLPGTEGEDMPDIGASPDAHDLVSFEARVPGDVVVHHARTVHGAPGNTSTDRRRRAISVRYCGDDARYRMRPGAPRKPHHRDDLEGLDARPPGVPAGLDGLSPPPAPAPAPALPKMRSWRPHPVARSAGICRRHRRPDHALVSATSGAEERIFGGRGGSTWELDRSVK